MLLANHLRSGGVYVTNDVVVWVVVWGYRAGVDFVRPCCDGGKFAE